MVRRLLLPNGWPSHFTRSWSNMISYWTVCAYCNTLVGDAADWDSLSWRRDWWMGQETEGRRGCKVREPKAGVLVKVYTVCETGRTVASVTNDLPFLAIRSALPGFCYLCTDIRFYYILQVRICAICCDIFSVPVCETISEHLRMQALWAVLDFENDKIFGESGLTEREAANE